MWPFKKKRAVADKPPVDMNTPVTNPRLLRAMEAFGAAPSDATWAPLLRELQQAVFLGASFMDGAVIDRTGPGAAHIEGGSKIKLMLCGEPPLLALFTDWDQLRKSVNDTGVSGLVMPAVQAWQFASHHGGAVINPGDARPFPILPEVLAWLLKAESPRSSR